MSRRAMDPVVRFQAKVAVGDDRECWEWLGTRDRHGYGTLSLPGRRLIRSHRYAYELEHGPVPVGLVLDHICRNRACVNPSHLEPVTNRENILRGDGACARNARKTHCKRGHPLTEANVRLVPRGRACRQCQRDHAREWARRQRDQEQASVRLKPVIVWRDLPCGCSLSSRGSWIVAARCLRHLQLLTEDERRDFLSPGVRGTLYGPFVPERRVS